MAPRQIIEIKNRNQKDNRRDTGFLCSLLSIASTHLCLKTRFSNLVV
jgi:hypothetical protein